MKIITISREFGSGGREIGKRISDILNMNYYDREILTAIAKNTEMDERYIESIINNGSIHSFPLTFGRTKPYFLRSSIKLLKKLQPETEHFTYKKLLRFTLPSIIMMVFTSIYGVIDGFFVSNFVGKTPFAAVNFIMWVQRLLQDIISAPIIMTSLKVS